MKYLLRAAGRLEPGAAPKTRPAIPSRSPLAAADQRLNLDAFAARFDASATPASVAPPLEEEGTELLPTPAPRPVARAATEATRPASPPARSVRITQTTSRPEASQDESRAHDDTDMTAPPRPSRAVGRDSRPTAPSTFAEAQTPRPPEIVSPPGSFRRPNSLPAPEAHEGQTHVPSRTREASESAGGERPTADAVPDKLLEALGRAMSWVGAQPTPAHEPQRDDEREPATRPIPPARPAERLPARLSRPAARERQQATKLEIGRIEVEVMPPSRPAQQASPPRPARPADSGGGALRQPFGWRQR